MYRALWDLVSGFLDPRSVCWMREVCKPWALLTPLLVSVSVPTPVAHLARELKVSISWLRQPDTRPQTLTSLPRLRSCVLSFDDNLYGLDSDDDLWPTVFQKLQGISDVPQLRLLWAPESWYTHKICSCLVNLVWLKLDRPFLAGSELDALSQLPRLERLTLTYTQVITVRLGAGDFPALRHLALEHCTLDGESTAALGDLGSLHFAFVVQESRIAWQHLAFRHRVSLLVTDSCPEVQLECFPNLKHWLNFAHNNLGQRETRYGRVPWDRLETVLTADHRPSIKPHGPSVNLHTYASDGSTLATAMPNLRRLVLPSERATVSKTLLAGLKELDVACVTDAGRLLALLRKTPNLRTLRYMGNFEVRCPEHLNVYYMGKSSNPPRRALGPVAQRMGN